MTIYRCRTTFDSFRFAADFAQAADTLYTVTADGDGGYTRSSTPYQVADARHDPAHAARLLLEYFGRDYWLDPSLAIGEDEDGNETFDGQPKDDYLDGLIVSVEPEPEEDEEADA